MEDPRAPSHGKSRSGRRRTAETDPPLRTNSQGSHPPPASKHGGHGVDHAHRDNRGCEHNGGQHLTVTASLQRQSTTTAGSVTTPMTVSTQPPPVLRRAERASTAADDGVRSSRLEGSTDAAITTTLACKNTGMMSRHHPFHRWYGNIERDREHDRQRDRQHDKKHGVQRGTPGGPTATGTASPHWARRAPNGAMEAPGMMSRHHPLQR